MDEKSDWRDLGICFGYLIECAENNWTDMWNTDYLKYLASEWNRLYHPREWDRKYILELVRHPQFKRPDFSDGNFREAISRGVGFHHLHLEGANFFGAHLEGAYILMAYLDGAQFIGAHLEKTKFRWTQLERANFYGAHLGGADLRDAHLEGANFYGAHLEEAYFNGAYLEGAEFTYAVVDGGTLFSKNSIDDKTNFTGTALSATRIDPSLRTKLERNIREIQWRDWYCKSKISPLRFLKKLTGKVDETEEEEKEKECKPSMTDRIFINPFVKLFWCLTDYGSSTKRVVGVFFAWNILWACIYQFLLPLQSSPILAGTNTTVLHTPNIITAVMQTNLMVFSITDVATRNLDYPALIFVTVQIVVGYFILAALITRLGIMFQNLSP